MHSVITCHPAEVTFQPLPQPKLVVNLATPEGCKAELTFYVRTVMVGQRRSLILIVHATNDANHYTSRQPSGILIHVAVLPQQTWGGELGPHLTQCRLGRGLPPSKWHLDQSSHFATTDMGQKLGEGWLCPCGGRGPESPSNIVWPGPRPTCMSSFILIRPTVWPQYTNVTDRTDRQTDNGPIVYGEPFYKRLPK